MQQRGYGAGDVGLPVADQRRVGTDGFDRDTGRQKIAFGIENVAAARIKSELALGVLLGANAQFVMAQHLEIDQPVTQAHERQDQQHGQQHQAFEL